MAPAALPSHRQHKARQHSSAPSKDTTGASAQAVAASSVPQLSVQRCWGLGSSWTAPACAWHPNSPGCLAYTAGCYLVLLDTASKQQLHTYAARQQAPLLPLQCLAFHPDGQYVAAGEGCTAEAAAGTTDTTTVATAMTVWSLSNGSIAWQQHYHKEGVASVAFNHDGRLLLSSGAAYDAQLCIWDWQSSGALLVRVATHCSINGACLNHDTTALLAAGKDQLKMWAISSLKGSGAAAHKARPSSAAGPRLALTPKPLSLRDHKDSTFVAVKVMLQAPAGQTTAALHPASNVGDVYALTSHGSLLLFKAGNGNRSLDASVTLHVSAAYCMDLSHSMVAVGCASGVVRLVAAQTLSIIGNLPRPSLTFAAAQRCASGGGSHQSLQDAACGPLIRGGGGTASSKAGPVSTSRLKDGRTALAVPPGDDLFPAAVATAFDKEGACLSVCYSDHSLIIWNVSDVHKVTRLRSLMAHAGPVWDAAALPAAVPSYCVSAAAAAQQVASRPTSIPLVTCSADGTLRVWNISLSQTSATQNKPTVMGIGKSDGVGSQQPGLQPPTNYARAAGTLRGVVVVQPPAAVETDQNHDVSVAPNKLSMMPAGEMQSHGGALIAASSKLLGRLPNQGAGSELRCLCVSADCRHLAVGDAQGNVRVYDMGTLALVVCKEAHEGPVTSLEFSPASLGTAGFLVSGGKDGVLHVFDVGTNYTLVNTLDEHAAAVLAVRFSACGRRLVSLSADNNLLMRDITDPADCTTHTYKTVQLPVGSNTAARQQAASRLAARPRTAGPAAARSAGSAAIPSTAKAINKALSGTVYDMAVDPNSKFLVVATEGWLRCLDMATGQEWGVVEASPATGGGFLRVRLDASGTLAFCACANGSVAVVKLPSAPSARKPEALSTARNTVQPAPASSPGVQTLLAYGKGHAGPARCVQLFGTHGVYGLISIGEDGCIIQHDVPSSVISALQNSSSSNSMPVHVQNIVPALDGCTRPLQKGVSLTTATAGRLVAGPAGRPASAGKSKLPPAPSPAAIGNKGVAVEALSPESPQPCTLTAMWADPEQRALLSQTLARVAQGQPLVSPDKLPRWAAARLNNPAPAPVCNNMHAQKPAPTAPTELAAAAPTSYNSSTVQQPGASQAELSSAANRVSAPELSSVQHIKDMVQPAVLHCFSDAGGLLGPIAKAVVSAVGPAADLQQQAMPQNHPQEHGSLPAAAAAAQAPGQLLGGVWGEGFDLEEDDGLVLFDEKSMEQLPEQQDWMPGKAALESGRAVSAGQGLALVPAPAAACVPAIATAPTGTTLQTALATCAGDGHDADDAVCPSSGAGSYNPAAKLAAMGCGTPADGQSSLPVCRDLFRQHYGPHDQASSSNTPTLAWPVPKLVAGDKWAMARQPSPSPGATQKNGAGPDEPFGSPCAALPPAITGDSALLADEEGSSRRLSLTAAVRRLATSLLSAGAAGEEAVIQATTPQGNHASGSHPNQLFDAAAAAAAASGGSVGPTRSRLAGPKLSPAPASANNSTLSCVDCTAGGVQGVNAAPDSAAMEATAVGPNWDADANSGPQFQGARGLAGPDGLEATSAYTPPQQPTRLAAARMQNQRAGRMEDDLAKMRERLSQLQATFAAQQARNTPWKQRLQAHRRASAETGADDSAGVAQGAARSTGSSSNMSQPETAVAAAAAGAGAITATAAALKPFDTQITPVCIQGQQPRNMLQNGNQDSSKSQQEIRRESLALTSPRGAFCYDLQDSPAQPLKARLMAAASPCDGHAQGTAAQHCKQGHRNSSSAADSGATEAAAPTKLHVHANAIFNGEPTTPCATRTHGEGLQFVANAAASDGAPTPTLLCGPRSHRVSNLDPEADNQHSSSPTCNRGNEATAICSQPAPLAAAVHAAQPVCAPSEESLLPVGAGAVVVVGTQPAAEAPSSLVDGASPQVGSKQPRVPVQLPMFVRPPVRHPSPSTGRFSSMMEAAQAMAAEQQQSQALSATAAANGDNTADRIGSAGKAGMLAAGSPSKGGKVLSLAQAFDAASHHKTGLTPRQSGMLQSHLPRPPTTPAAAAGAVAEHQADGRQSPLQLQAAVDQLAHAVDALQLCCSNSISPGGPAALPEDEGLRTALLHNMQRLQHLLLAGQGLHAA